MMSFYLRLVAFLFILLSLLIGISHFSGQSMETDAFATYRVAGENEGYVVYINDPSRHISLDLMETQCFDNIPYGDLQLIHPEDPPQLTLPLGRDNPMATIYRLSCTNKETNLLYR